MNKIVVLGGSGMLGHQLVKELDRNGFYVKSTWNTVPPNKIPESYSKNVTWSKFPTNNRNWLNLIKGAEIVFHLANSIWTISRLGRDPDGPLAELKKNTQILDNISHSGVKKLIWISSSTGYSNEFEPVEENFQKGIVSGGYASLANVIRRFENQLSETAHKNKIDIRVFRPTTIIGCPSKLPSENSHAFLRLINDLLIFKRAKIYSPDIERNYIYSKDFSSLLLDEIKYKIEPGTFEAYNVRSNLSCNLTEIAKIVIRRAHLESDCVSQISTKTTPRVIDLPAQKLKNRHKMPQTALDQIILDIMDRIDQLRKS